MDPSLLGRPIPAPTAQRSTGLITKQTLFVVIGLLVAIVIGGLLLLGSGDNSGQLQQRLSARQTTTQALIADGQKNLTSGDLKKINSELQIILASDTNQLQAALTVAGLKKIDKTVVAAEADTATFQKLTTAKLNGQYDTAYKNVLTQKLESLNALIKELHAATKSTGLKTALNNEYKHVAGYIDTLATQTP